ncbi:MAG: hypothetical protein ACT4PZ_10950 [Panacagrimonas sp.]
MMRVVLLLVCCGLAACGANSYCLVPQEYQNARIVPELRAAEGLEVPESPSALRLPKPPTNPEPFGRKAEDGTGLCLDRPPPLKLPAKSAEVGAAS